MTKERELESARSKSELQPAIKAGEVQYEECPLFPDLGFEPGRMATKYCDHDGSWWIHPETNK